MKTLDLQEAAHFLKMHPEEIRRRAKEGKIPGAKVGRAWVFIDIDLADYVRSLYAQSRQALRVTLGKELESCHSENATQSGGSTSLPQTGSEYANLLGLVTKPSRKNCTTS
jgi:hypothetical protein